MSGSAPTSVAVGVGGGEVGYGGYRPPFTAMQWQELEHQAMIYKYLVAGLPIPPDLVVPIRRSFEAISARFFNHPSLTYCSYYGKKFDPEPGRCRRTDGKKWRCSKDAYPDSKYCERHMHRGRNRSRKPVESQPTSQSMSTAMSNTTVGSSSNSSSFQNSGVGSFQSMPFYPVVSSEGLCFGSNVTKLQMEPVSYGINSKEYRYTNTLTPDTTEHNFSLESSGSLGDLRIGSTAGSSWRLMPSQVSPSSLLKQKSDSDLDRSSQVNMARSFNPMDDTMSKKRQHCFFGGESGSLGAVKQEENSMRPFFDEWPTAKESWANLEGDGSNKSLFSTTQLSISIPLAPPEFSSRSTCTQNDG